MPCAVPLELSAPGDSVPINGSSSTSASVAGCRPAAISSFSYSHDTAFAVRRQMLDFIATVEARVTANASRCITGKGRPGISVSPEVEFDVVPKDSEYES